MFSTDSACAAGIARNFYIGQFSPLDEPDYTWGMRPADIWLCIEATYGIVCACMANLTPLYGHLRRGIRAIIGSHNDGPMGTLGACNETGKSTLELPHYMDSKLLLRPRGEDKVRLTTLAMTVVDRDSYENAEYGSGIRVRSELTQTVHDADQNSFTSVRTSTDPH